MFSEFLNICMHPILSRLRRIKKLLFHSNVHENPRKIGKSLFRYTDKRLIFKEKVHFQSGKIIFNQES